MAIENTYPHQQIDSNEISTHIIEAGNNKRPTILFLHSYPENWGSFAECNGPIKRKLSYFISVYAGELGNPVNYSSDNLP